MKKVGNRENIEKALDICVTVRWAYTGKAFRRLPVVRDVPWL